MATRFEHVQRFSGSPEAVMEMLRNPDYIRLKCESTGSLETTVEVADTADGGCILTSTRVLPAKVPSAAKRFVGETITVTEVQTWTPLSGGSASAKGEVGFSAPLDFTATLTLAADGEETVVTTTGSFKAGVPFVGGSIESSAVDLTAKYLTVEETVGNEWLAR